QPVPDRPARRPATGDRGRRQGQPALTGLPGGTWPAHAAQPMHEPAPDVRPGPARLGVTSDRQVRLDDGQDLGGVGHGARPEPRDDQAVRPEYELLEVPLNVARGARRVGHRGQLVVDRVPAWAVDLDLLKYRERHAVG